MIVHYVIMILHCYDDTSENMTILHCYDDTSESNDDTL